MALQQALLIYFTAYRTSHEAIEQLLNAREVSQRDERTRLWRDYKLQELYFVGITVRPRTNRERTGSGLIFDRRP